MESIYDPKCFRASEPLNTKEYFEEYRKVCPFEHEFSSEDNTDKFKTGIVAYMGVSQHEFDINKLEQACSIEHLRLPSESENAVKDIPEYMTTKTEVDAYPIIEEAKSLNVIRCKEIMDPKTNMEVIFNKRFLKQSLVPSNNDTSNLGDIAPGTNFIFSVYVYKPYSICYGQRNSGEKMRFAMEIEALGTNTLTELVDSIQCISNSGLFKEVENTKVNLSQLKDAKKHYPSQTIFIEGVFYNDFRSKNAKDYSKHLIEWAKTRNIGNFTTAKMEEVLLQSLSPRFGYPYVYIHQGNCEHIISFADARMVQPGDLLVSSKYPRIYCMTRTMKPLCFICAKTRSNWIVKNCNKFPYEKVFLCTVCCNSFLYIDGKKVGKFQLYPYHDID